MKVNGNKVKKISLLMALLAPMIYLFGTLFEALKGANGEQVLAEPVYVQEYVEVDSYANDGSTYRLTIDESVEDLFASITFAQVTYTFDFSYSVLGYTGNGTFLRFGRFAPSNIVVLYLQAVGDLVRYNYVDNTYSVVYAQPWTFVSDSFPLAFLNYFLPYSKLEKYVYVPSSVVIESPSSYSDYLFKNFFVKNNFLSASGEKVINGTPDYGFVPAADMIRFVDGNMFHLANVEWGYLVIGYTYYAFHVVCVFLIFNLLMFFPHLIENVYERFERGW